MAVGDRRLTAKSTDFERSEAVAAALGGLKDDIRGIQAGAHRVAGSSFQMPLILVGPSGSWTIDEVVGSLQVTGPGGTVTVLAAP